MINDSEKPQSKNESKNLEIKVERIKPYEVISKWQSFLNEKREFTFQQASIKIN